MRGVIEDGRPVVYRNGVKLDEPYLNKYPLVTENIAQASCLGLRCTKRECVPRSYDPNKPFDEQPFYHINPANVNHNFDGSLYLRMPGTAHRSPTGRAMGARQWNGTDEFDIMLGENEYWLMGDNRQGSKDSRCFGPYNTKYRGHSIHGRIVFRIWSNDTVPGSWMICNVLTSPIGYFKNKVRWSRILQPLY
jgi:hypothetical protein